MERTKRKDAATSLRERVPRRLLLLLLLLVLIGSRTMQALLSETVLSGGVGGGEGAIEDGGGGGGGASGGGGGSTVVGVEEAFGDLFARQERRSAIAEAAVPSQHRPPHSPVDELVAGLWGSAASPSPSQSCGNPFGGSPVAPGNPFGATRPTPTQSLGTGGGAAAPAANPFDV